MLIFQKFKKPEIMKTKYLLFIMLAFVSFIALQAQEITSDIMPGPGEQIHLIYCSEEGVAEGGAGENITWDFTSLVPNSEQEYEDYIYGFLNPATTPYGNLFPAAQLSAVQWDTGYVYYVHDENMIETIGFAINVNNSDFTATYTNYETNLLFPFSYGQSWDDDLAYAQSGMGFTDTVTGNKTFEVDGYGTLKLPDNKTYNNVLRIKDYKIIYLSGGLFTIQYQYYRWYSPEYKLWLLEIGYDNNDNNGWVNIGVYYADNPLPLGIKANNEKLRCNISPNPAKGHISIRIPENSSSINTVEIFDQFSRLVKTVVPSNPENSSGLQIPINDLGDGLYIVKITTQDKIYTSKLLVGN